MKNDTLSSSINYYGIAVGVNTDGSVFGRIGSGPPSPAGRRSFATQQSLVVPGSWHHVVVTFAGTQNVQIAIDGASRFATETGGGTADTMVYSTGSGSIGGYTDSFFFAGSIDDVRLYSRALSAAEIQALYAEGG